MPTYDYVCDACGHAFELFQSITDSVKKKCPECTRPKLRRLFGTGAAVMFKGSGFYQTDYRSESYKKAAKADSGSDGGSSGKDGSSGKGGSSGKPETGAGKSESAPAQKEQKKDKSKKAD